MKKPVLKMLQLIALVAGLALFAYLIHKTGLDTLARYLHMMGWGFAFIILLSAVRNVLRASSWYYAIDPVHRQIRFWTLMNVMLAGEAIKYLTVMGPLFGEPAKAAMVRRQVPLLQGFSSVVVENLIYNLTVIIVMITGLPALVWLIDAPRRLQLGAYLFTAAIILSLVLVWAAIRRRWFILARMLEVIARLTVRRSSSEIQSQPTRFAATIDRVRKVEANIYAFYENRRGAFFAIFAVNMVAHFINVIEVYVILMLLDLPATLAAGFLIEAVTKVINGAFFFVPTRAGVYESGNALVLDALGMTASAGVALAIIRKLRAFLWVGYGLVVIGWLALKDKRAPENAQTPFQSKI